MNQGFIKILMCIFMLTFLVGTVSAFEFDNIKSYDYKTKTATISNSLLWFFELDEVADITLDTPQVVYVIAGKDRKVAEFTIDNYADGYPEALRKIDFYDKKQNLKKTTKEFNYKYKDYEEQDVPNIIKECFHEEYKNGSIKDWCEVETQGTKKELVEVWLPFDSKTDLPKGKITIGIFTDVQTGEHIEWIPTFFGVEIDEWAEWTESLNDNITAYYTMNESAFPITNAVNSGHNNGTDSGSTAFVTNGKIGGTRHFDDTDYITINDENGVFDFEGKDFTINWWDNKSAGGSGGIARGVTGTYSAYFIEAFGEKVYMSCDGSSWAVNNFDLGTVVEGTYVMRTLRRSGTNLSAWENGVAVNSINTLNCALMNQSGTSADFGRVQGGAEYHDGDIDEVGFWERALTSAELTQLYNGGDGITYQGTFATAPVVALSVPANNTISTTGVITFNCSATDVNSDLTNVSLWINGVANFSNTTVASASFGIEKEVTFTTEGFYNWTCKGTDSGALTGVAGSRNFTYDGTAPVVSNATNITTIVTPTLPVNSSWNYTVTDNIKLDDCYYNTSDNATLTFVTCNVSDIKTQWQTSGDKTIYYCANDTANSETCKNNSLTIDYYSYGQSGDKYVAEGTAHTYTLKINNTNIPTTSVRFVFNGTSYAPTTTVSSANTYNFTKVFTIPDGIGNNTGRNDTWYWAVNMTSKAKFNTTFQNVSVYSVEMDNCTVFGTVILNMSLRDEETNSPITILTTQNTTVELDMRLTSELNSSLYWDFSTEWINETNLTVCVPDGVFTGSSTAFTLDINEIRYFADNYVTEFYYLDSYNLTNATVPKFIALMDLLSADSTSFVVSYTDDNNLLVSDAIISVLRKYEEEGVFREVENGKTSDVGETILHLVEEDVVYIFNVTIGGADEYESTQYRVYCEAGSTCTITLDASSEVDDFTPYWDSLPEGTYNLTVNRTSRTITLTFNLNETATMNLTIYQYSNNESVMDIPFVSNTTTASSGVTYVYVPTTYGNETFYATIYKDGVYIASHFVDLWIDISTYVGLPLTAFMIALIIMTMGLMAIATGVGVIIFGIFGVMIAVFMALITSSGTWSIISIVIAGVIVIGMIYKRRSRT